MKCYKIADGTWKELPKNSTVIAVLKTKGNDGKSHYTEQFKMIQLENGSNKKNLLIKNNKTGLWFEIPNRDAEVVQVYKITVTGKDGKSFTKYISTKDTKEFRD